MSVIYEAIRIFLQNLADKGLLFDSFKYAFVINAVLCALIIGPLLGMVGTLVVAKKMAFFSNAIGNAALTGIAIGIALGEPVSSPYISLYAFAVIFSIFLNFSRNRSEMSNDTLIGVFLAGSIALGSSMMLLVTQKINIHLLDTFMFGSILTATDGDITQLVIILIITLALLSFFYNAFFISGMNSVMASVRKVPVKILDYVFVVLIAIITVASVKIVGAILVEALLVIPAAAARNISRSLRSFFVWSIIFATFSSLFGIIFPVESNMPIPSGGAIVITATIIFLITFIIQLLKKSSIRGAEKK